MSNRIERVSRVTPVMQTVRKAKNTKTTGQAFAKVLAQALEREHRKAERDTFRRHVPVRSVNRIT